MKTGELILKMLTDLQDDVKKIRTEDIPALQVSHATLNQRVQDEAKAHSRAYARVYGLVAIAISLSGVLVAFFKH